jgi:hypothetical protein
MLASTQQTIRTLTCNSGTYGVTKTYGLTHELGWHYVKEVKAAETEYSAEVKMRRYVPRNADNRLQDYKAP